MSSLLKSPVKLFLIAFLLIAIGFGLYILELITLGVIFILAGALIGAIAYWVYELR